MIAGDDDEETAIAKGQVSHFPCLTRKLLMTWFNVFIRVYSSGTCHENYILIFKYMFCFGGVIAILNMLGVSS